MDAAGDHWGLQHLLLLLGQRFLIQLEDQWWWILFYLLDLYWPQSIVPLKWNKNRKTKRKKNIQNYIERQIKYGSFLFKVYTGYIMEFYTFVVRSLAPMMVQLEETNVTSLQRRINRQRQTSTDRQTVKNYNPEGQAINIIILSF